MNIKIKITRQSNADYYNCKVGDVITISLHDYLCSVVASEVGNANIEACKAQAIASRTYAYQYWYNGKTITDSSSTAQAFRAERISSTAYQNAYDGVTVTKGMVLEYQNIVINSCPFSESNGGRTTSSEKRWGGFRPWLTQKNDPWDYAASNGVKSGHGVGMSQAGAKYAADHGVQYKDILSFYYPGTDIKVIGKKELTMNKVSKTQFVEMAEKIFSQYKNCTYKNGKSGECVSGVFYCDCRGYIIWAMRKLGINITSTGTNWMIRNQMTSVNMVSNASQLQPGMVVFKSRTDISKLPDRYLKGKQCYNPYIGVIDVYHVGIVIQTSPSLIIRHCTSGGIKTDTKLGKWNWAGWVEWVDSNIETAPPIYTVQTTGGILFLRIAASKSSSYIDKIPNGTVLSVISDEGDWYKVKYKNKTGYVMKQFVSIS